MKTILATAYAINPFKGSEDGMGWNFVMQIARHNRVVAITRQNNRPHIERYMALHPHANYKHVKFYYFDLPYWMRFWKKGNFGAMVYYWLWQRTLPAFIIRQNLQFDIAHNVNFHNDWTPSHLWKLGKPFVWGPIGHHTRIPISYLRNYATKYILIDRLTWFIKKMFWCCSLALKHTANNASHILCMNTEVSKVVGIDHVSHSLMPSVATDDFGYRIDKPPDMFKVLSAGRLVPLKGFDLTLQSFALFINSLPLMERTRCELTIVGSGPEKKRYEQFVKEKGLQQNVQFLEWIDRDELLEMYRDSSLFLFPSHEGAGMVVAEALSFALPVVCLEDTGPGEFIDENSGIKVTKNAPQETIVELAKALDALYNDPALMRKLARGARHRFENHFHWDVRGDKLLEIYQNIA